MCLSYSSVGNYYIDFSRIQSFNKNLIVNLINSNKIKLEYSLSQFGWYFLLTKMTIHFMRVEDHKLFSTRLKVLKKMIYLLKSSFSLLKSKFSISSSSKISSLYISLTTSIYLSSLSYQLCNLLYKNDISLLNFSFQ